MRYGVGVTYWGLPEMNGYTSIRGDSLPAGTVSTPIDVTNGNPLIGGVPAANFFDNATEHRIWRNNSFQNLEINFLSQTMVNTSRSQVTWLAGIRYLPLWRTADVRVGRGRLGIRRQRRTERRWRRGSVCEHKVKNDLVGLQLGGRADYFFTPRFGVYIAPKIGMFGNDITARNTLQSGTGALGFDIAGSSNTFSMLGELDAGLSYQLRLPLACLHGLPVLGVTNVALGDNQFLPFLVDAGGFADVKDNGSLILHGATAGLQFTF